MKKTVFAIGLVLLAAMGCENGDVPEWNPADAPEPMSLAETLIEPASEEEPEPEAEMEVEPIELTVQPTTEPTPQLGDESMEGIAQPTEFVELSVLIAGLIDEVHVREGQKVKSGHTLISLDSKVPAARVAVAEADAKSVGALRRAEVNLRVAELYLKRLLGASPDAIRPFEIEEAEGKRDEAMAIVQEQKELLEAAKATHEVAKAQLQQYKVCSPFDGVIIEIHQRSGVADPRNAIIKLANLDRLEVELHVPSSRFGKIKVGDELQLTAAAPVSKTMKASVASVSPLIDSASNTFRCLLQIDNTNGDLPAGFTVRLAK